MNWNWPEAECLHERAIPEVSIGQWGSLDHIRVIAEHCPDCGKGFESNIKGCR